MYATYDAMKKKFVETIREFRPPLILSVFLAIVFSAFSICTIATDWFESFPEAVTYVLYGCAVLFLSLAIWASVLFLQKTSPKQQFLEVAGKNSFTAKLTQDFSYRTTMITYCSLVFNVLLAASKLFAGWYYSSTWLMVLAGYYIVLCLSKFLLLRYGGKQAKLTDKSEMIKHEWKVYRLCGVTLLVLTTFLQGVVIMIIRDGMGFAYNEIVVIAVATYDFYCLSSAIVYMVRKRRTHSPIINSLKSISLASTLVAILSLQTAMFSSFGTGEDEMFKPLMNTLTGTAVCVFLIALGIFMIVRSSKELKPKTEESI